VSPIAQRRDAADGAGVEDRSAGGRGAVDDRGLADADDGLVGSAVATADDTDPARPDAHNPSRDDSGGIVHPQSSLDDPGWLAQQPRPAGYGAMPRR
jgi:hypothetical protein